jgi:hypothetical protein
MRNMKFAIVASVLIATGLVARAADQGSIVY